MDPVIKMFPWNRILQEASARILQVRLASSKKTLATVERGGCSMFFKVLGLGTLFNFARIAVFRNPDDPILAGAWTWGIYLGVYFLLREATKNKGEG